MNYNGIKILLAIALLTPVICFAGSKGNGGGKDKGGSDTEATGATLFVDTDMKIHSDRPDVLEASGRIYVHGIDGQITIPKRYRHDLKKFNVYDREIVFEKEVGVSANAYIWQTHNEAYQDGTPTSPLKELDFPNMTPGSVTRVSLDIQIGRQLHLYFGGLGFYNDPTGVCDEGNNPVWVKAHAANEDGVCTAWTISTRDLSQNPSPTNVRACLVSFSRGSYDITYDVEADFEIQVVTLPLP